ncbi:MAG: hypothetical protein EB084_05795 [Proteobacteria bacterium]|nr:hypothetical protein [Pseudomonadota bacterium]
MVNPLHGMKAAPAPAPSRPTDGPAAADATVSYNSQDQVVFGSTPTVVPNVTVDGGNLSVPQAQLNTSLTPNADGAYVYDAADQGNHTAALTFAATAKTITAFEAALGQPVQWAFGAEKLQINPDAGEDFNAYYARDEQSINFFHATDPKTSENIMSGGSGEVVSHETGHALLDGIRPGYFSSWTPDVGAFHEAFGDMMGIMMAFQDENSVKLAAQQTGGDLTKPNCIAETGEQLGIAINDYVGEDVTGGNFVRTAINSFTWQDPNDLPSSAPPDQLSSEVHSFSRLWSGAFYDVVAGIQARNMAAGMDAECALKSTGEETMKLIGNAMKDAPQGDFTYRDMANAWIAADQKYNNGANGELMTQVFTNRGILGDAPVPDPGTPGGGDDDGDGDEGKVKSNLTTVTGEGRKPLDDLTRSVQVRLDGPQFGMFQGAKVSTLVDKDGSLGKDTQVSSRVKNNVARYIAEGRIRYNDPGYKMKPQDAFDSKGRPYMGFVRWENGEMVIERNKVVN